MIITTRIILLSDKKLRAKALDPKNRRSRLFWLLVEIDRRQTEYFEDGTDLYILTESELREAKRRLWGGWA